MNIDKKLPRNLARLGDGFRSFILLYLLSFSSACTLSPINFTRPSRFPPDPYFLTIKEPSVSVGGLSTPTITVSGVESGDTVKLFTDSKCTNEVGSTVATGDSVDITSSAIPTGTTSFYTKTIDSSEVTSNCSIRFVNYTFQYPVFSLARSTYTISDTGDEVGELITVVRDIPGGDYEVTLTSDAITAGASDVTFGSQTIQFVGDDLSETVDLSSLSPAVNTTVEGDKFFRIRLSAPTNSGQLGDLDDAQVNLLDGQLSEEFYFLNTLISVNEDSGFAEATIQRAGSTVAAASVQLSFLNGTATSGTDYDNSTLTVNFAAGEAESVARIPIIDRGSYQANRSFYIQLTNPSAGTALRPWATAKVRILDTDDTVTCDASNDDLAINLGFGGLSGGVYRICSLTQLFRVRNNLTLNFRLMADLDLDPSIDADSVTGGLQPFVPMTGTFSGIFQGDEHVLKNFRYTQTSAAANPVALFSSIGGNTSVKISGLNLIQAYNRNTFSNGDNAGIVGVINQIDTLSDNYFSGLVESTGATSSSAGIMNRSEGSIVSPLIRNFSAGFAYSGGNAGGILAAIYMDGVEADISTSYSVMNIQAGGSGGGIYGGQDTSTPPRNGTLTVQNSHARGVLMGAGAGHLGGLVGFLGAWTGQNASITNSFATGPIHDGYDTGGLVGTVYCPGGAVAGGCDITSSSASGTVSNELSTRAAGGFIGFHLSTGVATIDDSLSTGSVITTANANGIGGFIGIASPWSGSIGATGLTIQNSAAEGSVTATGSTSPTGGFIGHLFTGDANGRIVIENCEASGDVSATPFVGGLIGRAEINQIGNTIEISNSLATGALTGSYYVGGIVGQMVASVSGAAFELDSVISRSSITANDDAVGGIAGFVNLLATNSSFELSGSRYETGSVTGRNFVGGLVGSISVAAVANMNVDITRSSSANAVIATGNRGGGLVGRATCASGAASKVFTVSRSYSTATVSGSVGAGLIADVEMNAGCSMAISDSFANGAISGTNSAAAVSDFSAAGGGTLSLTRIYSSAIRNGATSYGLSNGSAPTVSNSYWLKDTGINASIADDTYQRTATFLGTSTNFTGWDFDPMDGDAADWTMSPGPYPSLVP